MKKQSGILGVCAFAFGANMALFLIKLYVGLSADSISIFSDAVNNLFDSLSGLLSLICLGAVIKSSDPSTQSIVKKSEQLLSFIMAIIVALTGFYFAYSSLERLMYPTPVWYMEKYLIMLLLTAAAKIVMWFVYRLWSKNVDSPVIKVMSFDCILDFFITCVTILTLILSKNGGYSFDAIFGLIISTVIVVSAVRMTVTGAAQLINYVSADRRNAVEEALEGLGDGIKPESVTYYADGDRISAYVRISEQELEKASGNIDKVKIECIKKADVDLIFVKP
ncbi:MAG: cation transporter [Oscillospiraceae bacterium]|nr:cation transporter [Oscillospiraceae bacterium]